jgi:hypothetical protein
MTNSRTRRQLAAAIAALGLAIGAQPLAAEPLRLSEHETLEARRLSVLLYHNTYHPYFGDQKLGGLELILHDRRIATNGDVRLLPTPEQWDPIPTYQPRETDPATGRVQARCSYGETGLSYRIEVTPEGEGLRVALHLDAPLPESLAGQAAFSLASGDRAGDVLVGGGDLLLEARLAVLAFDQRAAGARLLLGCFRVVEGARDPRGQRRRVGFHEPGQAVVEQLRV